MGYFGSKATTGLSQALIALMPPHSVYIESHLGGGALMKRKPPAVRSIGIDRDERALEAFGCDYPVELVHGCAHSFLASFPFLGPELVYSDPPYLHATRRSSQRYRFEYEEADHVALLELLKGLPCQVMVSGHPSALYDERLAGWRRLALQVTTPGPGAHRGRVVQLHARPGALGELRGPQLHRPPAHQAQGGQLWPALRGHAGGRTPGGAGRDHGRRGREAVSMSPWHADLAFHEEAFACLQDLLTPQSLALTAVKAIREWGQGLLRLSAALVKENDALEGENARLRERIADLKRSAALDSTTSSRPPASDGLARKSATRKRTRSQRGTSAKPSGGQPGHEGTTLAQTGNPDHIVDHTPSACAGFGAPLSDADRHADPVRRQVFDVPEPQPLEVTEHRGHRCLCAACGAVTTAVFPNGVSAPVQYGPRITAWVTYLSHAQFIPEKRVAEVMSELFAVKAAQPPPSDCRRTGSAGAPPGASRASSIVSQRSFAPQPRSNTSTRLAYASPPGPIGSMCCVPRC